MDDIAAEDEGAVQLCLPCPAPHDARFVAEAPGLAGPCFLCTHAPAANDDVWLNEDKEDGVALLRELAAKAGELEVEAHVDLIYRFYHLELRKLDPTLPAWTRESVFEHLTQHDQSNDRLLISNGLTALNAQIQSLRQVCWRESPDPGGKAVPESKNIALMNTLVKSVFEGVRLRKSLV